MADRRKLLEGIAQKLPVLLGGAVAVTSAHALTPATGASDNASLVASPTATARSTTAPKLILRQANGDDVRLVASHDSHSSHASHASHASHSSHASRAI